MAHPGIVCVFIGITVATILYYMFGNNERERNVYTYGNDRSRYRQSNDYYENGHNSGFHRKNVSYSTDSDDCTICLTPLATRTKIILKPCNHAFHKSCIDEWKSKAYEISCPNCRGHIE